MQRPGSPSQGNTRSAPCGNFPAPVGTAHIMFGDRQRPNRIGTAFVVLWICNFVITNWNNQEKKKGPRIAAYLPNVIGLQSVISKAQRRRAPSRYLLTPPDLFNRIAGGRISVRGETVRVGTHYFYWSLLPTVISTSGGAEGPAAAIYGSSLYRTRRRLWFPGCDDLTHSCSKHESTQVHSCFNNETKQNKKRYLSENLVFVIVQEEINRQKRYRDSRTRLCVKRIELHEVHVYGWIIYRKNELLIKKV